MYSRNLHSILGVYKWENIMFYPYGQKEIDYLKLKDKRLTEVIDKIGPVDKDLFTAVIQAILGQQVSKQARENVVKEVIDKLSKIKGIGVWTAEMRLISALQRQDIFSFGYRKRYFPYGT